MNGKYNLPTGRKQEVQRPEGGRQREDSVQLVTLKKWGGRLVRGWVGGVRPWHVCRAASPFYTISYIT